MTTDLQAQSKCWVFPQMGNGKEKLWGGKSRGGVYISFTPCEGALRVEQSPQFVSHREMHTYGFGLLPPSLCHLTRWVTAAHLHTKDVGVNRQKVWFVKRKEKKRKRGKQWLCCPEYKGNTQNRHRSCTGHNAASTSVSKALLSSIDCLPAGRRLWGGRPGFGR